MKVVHIITGLTNGGAEAILTSLVTTDKSVTHEVISLQGNAHYGPLIESKGVPLHCLEMPKGKVNVKGLRKLFSLLRELQPSVVQTWMYHADLVGGCAALLSGKYKIVWGMHHTTVDAKKNSLQLRILVRVCTLFSYAVPRKIICCSQATKVVHQKIGYHSRKLTVIFNGYDLSRFSITPSFRDSFRQELSIDDDHLLLGMVGRWDPQKDHGNLIKALELFALDYQGRWSCLLVGEHIDEHNIELVDLISKSSVSANVKLLGKRNDVPKLMNALDLHILSSAFGEAFPNVVCEAMACGTPCVVTDVGDAAFIVGQTGWVVNPGAPEELAGALFKASVSLQKIEESKRRSKECATRISSNFSLQTMINNYVEVWRDILM